VRLEGLGKLKKSTSSGLEPATINTNLVAARRVSACQSTSLLPLCHFSVNRITVLTLLILKFTLKEYFDF
jgi:hypothetical protein